MGVTELTFSYDELENSVLYMAVSTLTQKTEKRGMFIFNRLLINFYLTLVHSVNNAAKRSNDLQL